MSRERDRQTDRQTERQAGGQLDWNTKTIKRSISNGRLGMMQNLFLLVEQGQKCKLVEKSKRAIARVIDSDGLIYPQIEF